MPKILSSKFLLLIIFAYPLTTSAQDFTNPCVKITRQALSTIPELYEQGNKDAVDSLLTEWEQSCGPSEYTIRLRTLLNIQSGSFNVYDFDANHYRKLLYYLEDVRFKALMDSVHENPRTFYLNYYGEPDLVFKYNDFTVRLANLLREKFSTNMPCSTVDILLNVYSNNLTEVSRAFKQAECISIPANYYKRQLRSTTNKLLVDAAIYATYWVPYGNNKLLGNHPGLGFLFGVGRKRLIIDLVCDFRFGKPKNSYTVMYDGQLTTTDHFFGGYFGLEAGHELKSFAHAKLYFFTGLGADGFDVIKSDPKREVEGKSITVLNLNGGLAYRWFSRDGSFMGVDLRHNFVNYKNPGGTDLSGNVITVRLLAGLLKNDKRQRELEFLNRIIK